MNHGKKYIGFLKSTTEVQKKWNNLISQHVEFTTVDGVKINKPLIWASSFILNLTYIQSNMKSHPSYLEKKTKLDHELIVQFWPDRWKLKR